MSAKIEMLTKVASSAIPVACGVMVTFSFLGRLVAVAASLGAFAFLAIPRFRQKKAVDLAATRRELLM